MIIIVYTDRLNEKKRTYTISLGTKMKLIIHFTEEKNKTNCSF